MTVVGSTKLETIHKIKAFGNIARKLSEAAEYLVMIIH
jgi:hypothetical protein